MVGLFAVRPHTAVDLYWKQCGNKHSLGFKVEEGAFCKSAARSSDPRLPAPLSAESMAGKKRAVGPPGVQLRKKEHGRDEMEQNMTKMTLSFSLVSCLYNQFSMTLTYMYSPPTQMISHHPPTSHVNPYCLSRPSTPRILYRSFRYLICYIIGHSLGCPIGCFCCSDRENSRYYSRDRGYAKYRKSASIRKMGNTRRATKRSPRPPLY